MKESYLIINPYKYEYPEIFISSNSPIFTPRRKKLKGYQKKSQLSTFNKNR